MFVSAAHAQAAGGGAPAGFDLVSLLPLVLIFVVFWFLLIRPQQKKMKQHREMIAAVRRGDRVLTAGGIIGTVTKVLGESELQVEIAEGVRVKVARATISEVLAKTEPARGAAAGDEDEEEEAEEASEVKSRSAKG
jgi:preprotein translocase subunit YajC